MSVNCKILLTMVLLQLLLPAQGAFAQIIGLDPDSEPGVPREIICGTAAPTIAQTIKAVYTGNPSEPDLVSQESTISKNEVARDGLKVAAATGVAVAAIRAAVMTDTTGLNSNRKAEVSKENSGAQKSDATAQRSTIAAQQQSPAAAIEKLDSTQTSASTSAQPGATNNQASSLKRKSRFAEVSGFD
jgi:hypothetical protein